MVISGCKCLLIHALLYMQPYCAYTTHVELVATISKAFLFLFCHTMVLMKRLGTISVLYLFACDSPFGFSLLDGQCSPSIDLFFLIDSTGTLGKEGHAKMRLWAVKLVDNFAIGTNQNQSLSGLTRVEVIQFWGASPFKSDPEPQVSVDIELGNYSDKKKHLLQKIRDLGYKNGASTIIPDGLRKLNQEIESRGSTARQIYALVLTDGIDDSTPGGYPTTTLEEETRILKRRQNVQVFAIGLGRVHRVTLNKIASSRGNVIISSSFEGALNKTYNEIITLLCGSNSTIPTLPTPGEFLLV